MLGRFALPLCAVRGPVRLCGRPGQLDRPAWLDRSVASPPLSMPAGRSCHPTRRKGDLSLVVLGIDAHKRSHTVVAVDDVGRKLGERTRGTTTADHLVMLTWAEQFGADRLWAVEDCRHLSRRLERDLLGAGERIARVPPKLMAHVRDSARSYGKSDRSTPSPSLVRRCVNPTCPPPPSTALPGRSACWP